MMETWLYQEGTLTILPGTAFESLSHALTSGAVWWEGTTSNGASLLIRCASITDVRLMTDEAIQAARGDSNEWSES